MRKTKLLGIVSGIAFFMSAVFSGSDTAAAQQKQLQILLVAAGASQITLVLMAKELEKKFNQAGIPQENKTD